MNAPRDTLASITLLGGMVAILLQARPLLSAEQEAAQDKRVSDARELRDTIARQIVADEARELGSEHFPHTRRVEVIARVRRMNKEALLALESARLEQAIVSYAHAYTLAASAWGIEEA